MPLISHASSVGRPLAGTWPKAPAGAWRRIAVYLATAATAIAHEMSFIEHLEELRRRLLRLVTEADAAASSL